MFLRCEFKWSLNKNHQSATKSHNELIPLSPDDKKMNGLSALQNTATHLKELLSSVSGSKDLFQSHISGQFDSATMNQVINRATVTELQMLTQAVSTEDDLQDDVKPSDGVSNVEHRAIRTQKSITRS